MDVKILTQMLAQYTARHDRMPGAICVHPVALVALALKESIAPVWAGIPVRVREIQPGGPHTGSLGISIIDGALRSFDV